MAALLRSSTIAISITKLSALLAGIIAAAAAARFAVPYWTESLSSSVPPSYLFVAVHLIIAAIWKLSDHKPRKNPNDVRSDAVKSKDLKSDLDLDVTPLNTAMDSPLSSSTSAESSVKESVDEEAMGLEDTWQTVVMKKNATWERSNRTAAVAAEVAGDRQVGRSLTFSDSVLAADGNDELNQRFEEFIKKNYDQIRSH